MKFTFLLIIVIAGSVQAGTADLAVQLEFNSVNGIVYEQQGEFTVKVTNFGPDIAAENAPTQLPITILTSIIRDNGQFTPEIQFAASPNNDNQECFFLLIIGDPPPGGGPSYAYDIDIPSIAVNETIECYGAYSTHYDSGTREVTWSVRNNYDDDPVSTNNTQTVVFGIAPRSVPVNDVTVLILLVLLMLSVVFNSSRKTICKL